MTVVGEPDPVVAGDVAQRQHSGQNHTAGGAARNPYRPMAFHALAGIAEGAPVTEPQPVGAAYYHQKANEIRGFARQSKFSEIAEELFKLAGRFDRMADLVERRQLSDTTSA